MKDQILKLLLSTGGQGPSCTRLIYTLNGVSAALCATLATLAVLFVYCSCQKAGPIYWGGVVALWTATLGFGGADRKFETDKADWAGAGDGPFGKLAAARFL